MDGEQFPDHVDGATSFGIAWVAPAPPGSGHPEARCWLVDHPGGIVDHPGEMRLIVIEADDQAVELTGGQLRQVADPQVLDWLDPAGADAAIGKPEGWDDVPPPDQLAFGLIGLGIVADSARGLDAAGRIAAVIVAGGILAAHLDERPEDAEILRLAGDAISEALRTDDEPVPADPVAAACRLMTADHDKSFYLGRKRLTEALGTSDLCTTEELLSALAAYVAQGGERATVAVCDWREDASGDFWNTCDEPWVFPDAGGPQENRMRLCPMCGKPLQFTPAIG